MTEARRWVSSERRTRCASARPAAQIYADTARLNAVWCIAVRRRSLKSLPPFPMRLTRPTPGSVASLPLNTMVEAWPDAEPSAPSSGRNRHHQRHQRSPESLPHDGEIQVRRGPVLEHGRTAVPARAPVELLDVGATALARDDRVALFARFRGQPSQRRRVLRAAERTASATEVPAAAADVTRESEATALDDIAPGGWRAAERALAEIPVVRREMRAARREQRLEQRAQTADRQRPEHGVLHVVPSIASADA